jgi:transcriptional regulator with XRE-family HTH domain
MNIAELRQEMGLSLEAFALRVGLSSKGYASQLERGEVTCSVRAALEIEKLSGGRIPASSLNSDVALVEEARRRQRDEAA